MKCSACGHDNSEHSTFCGMCRASLSAAPCRGIGGVPSELPMVSFPEAVRLGFSNYFRFRGRSTRAEYWWFHLFVVATLVGLVFVDMLMNEMRSSPVQLSGLWQVVTPIPLLTLGVRRLHDINRSGWWVLLVAVPVIGPLVLVRWALEKGDDGQNEYGQ